MVQKSFPMEAYIQARRYQMEQNAQPKNWQTALAGIANDYGQAYKQKKDLELKTAVEDRLMRQKSQTEALTKLFTDPNYEIKDDRGNIVPVDQRINIIPTVQQTGKMPSGFSVNPKPQRVYETEADKIAAQKAAGIDPRSIEEMRIKAGKYDKTPRLSGTGTGAEKSIYENYNKLVDNELAAKKHYDNLTNSGLNEGDLRVLQAQKMYMAAQKDRMVMFNKHRDILSNTPQGQTTPQPANGQNTIDSQIAQALSARGIPATPENILKAKSKLQQR